MPEDHVRIVGRIFESWNAGNFQEGVTYLDDQVLFAVPADFLESGVFVGPEGVEEFTRRFLAQYKRVTIEAKQMQAVGDTVLVRVIQRGEGRASGIDVGLEYFMLFTFRGEKIVRMESQLEEKRAREALGLSA